MSGSFNSGFGVEMAARFLDLERRTKDKIDHGVDPTQACAEACFELEREVFDRQHEAALREIRERGT